jgi:hypothetical protein
VRAHVRFAVVALMALVGCPATDPASGLTTTPAAQLYDYNQFVCGAMPVLIRHCSYLACHGNPAHAFRVFSSGKLRLGDVATRSDRDAPITAAEIQANFDSATGMLLTAAAPDQQTVDLQNTPLLRKPLRARFGGDEHHGVGIFPFSPAQTLEDDPEWGALTAWASGQKQPSPPSASCQALFMSLGVAAK